MNRQQLIFICGDWHGFWDKVNVFLNTQIRQNKQIQKLIHDADETEIIILQVGDYGFWPHKHRVKGFDGTRKPWDQYGVKTHMPGIVDENIKIYFAPGNHENWDALDELERQHPDKAFIEIQPFIYFSTFGSVLTLLDGTNVMFCGGADSVDKRQRIPGDEWWAQEVITYREMLKLPDPISVNIDWIISHTCPEKFELSKQLTYLRKGEDPSKAALDEVLEMYKPKRWFFGHYHDFLTGFKHKCQWTLFADLGNSRGKSSFTYVTITDKRTRQKGTEKKT